MNPLRFIVLIPHRDSNKLFQEYKQQLFAAGCAGAYSFPGVAPLALVSRAFTKEELKELAHSLRESSMLNGREGRMTLGSCGAVSYQGDIGLTLFGPVLDIPIPGLPLDTIHYQFTTLVLCAALINKEETSLMQDHFPQGPAIFFRAAMVANMLLIPLSSGAAGYSFEWKIGVPVWLPSYKRKG